MSPPKYKYNPTTHYMLEFPSPNWLLVSNSKLTSAAQDVVFFFFFPNFLVLKVWQFFQIYKLKISKNPEYVCYYVAKFCPKKVGAEMSLCNMVFLFNFVIPKFW